MTEQKEKELEEEFIQALSTEYTENRKLVNENLVGDELLENEHVQKCFIINSVMSSRPNLEAGLVCWIGDNKDIKKFINSYKITFLKTCIGYTYSVDYIDDTSKKNN